MEGSMKTIVKERSRKRIRARVAEAFRRLANAASTKVAWQETVRFYRSSGQAWARQLGKA
jgi:hypothetical protein